MNNGAPAFPKRRPLSLPDAEFHAIQALTFIGGDPEHAERFFALCGIGPGDLRRAASDPGFLTGVMDYLVADEPLLLLFAAASGVSPETIVAAHDRMTRHR